MYDFKRKFVLALMFVGVFYIVLIVYKVNKVGTYEYRTGLHHDNTQQNTSTLRNLVGEVENTTTKILFWTEFHRYDIWWPYMMGDSLHKTCGKHSCQFTYNKSELDTADALLFDIFRIRNFTLPEYHLPHQYWVLYTHEWLDYFSPANQQLRKGVFNISASYLKDSDILIKYGECFRRTEQQSDSLLNSPAIVQDKFALWLVSDCRTLSKRELYVANLINHIPIDIYGRCSQGRNLTFGHAQRVGQTTTDDLASNISRYKFYLAFENNFCKEYITEKVFKVMQDGIMTIPVVRGSGPYTGILPEGSYIDVDEFISPYELAKFLKRVAHNETLYQSYFKYRAHFKCENYAESEMVWPCSVCEGVSELKRSKKQKRLGAAQIKRFLPNGNCHYEVNKMNDMSLDYKIRMRLKKRYYAQQYLTPLAAIFNEKNMYA